MGFFVAYMFRAWAFWYLVPGWVLRRLPLHDLLTEHIGMADAPCWLC
jgi:hypothetical protein